jgi:uncharacterized protein (DUF1810 family)
MAHAAPADFVAAQDRVWPAVEAELGAGAKTSHWMWFVFPQLEGLGRSPTARFYGLADRAAAAAFLAHPVLGPRLRRAVDLLLAHRDMTAVAILGPVDALKLRSSLTLFAAAAPDEPRFRAALDAFFDGAPCPLTRARL